MSALGGAAQLDSPMPTCLAREERASERDVGRGGLCNRDKVDTAGGVPTEERFSGATEPIVLAVCSRNAYIFK